MKESKSLYSNYTFKAKEKSITQREILQEIGSIRHIGGIHKSLNAFALGLEIYEYKVKCLFHRISIDTDLIKDYELCIWALKRTVEFGNMTLHGSR